MIIFIINVYYYQVGTYIEKNIFSQNLKMLKRNSSFIIKHFPHKFEIFFNGTLKNSFEKISTLKYENWGFNKFGHMQFFFWKK